MNRYKKLWICLLLSMVAMVGCWDMTEIDRRLFVGSVGIDTSDEINKYTFHFSLPIAREIIGGEGGGGGGGGKAVATVSTVGNSIVDGARNLALRLNRDLFFEHMRVIVIGEDVARGDLKKVINPLIRLTEFNRRSRIAICEGEARKVMGVNPWTEKLKAEYLETVLASTGLSGKFAELDLGDFLRNLHSQKGDALVSKMAANKTQVSIGGAAVIKDFRLVGWLDEEETQGANFFLGKITGGDIVVEDPQGNGTVTFIILGEKSRLSLKAKEPIPEFSLDVYVAGNIASTTHGIILSLEDAEKLQGIVSKEITAQISKGVKKLKEIYKVDVLKLSDHLYKHEPELWRKYEESWGDVYPNVKIDIKVHTTVKNIGVIR
jgi:spore germination protein KC